MIEATVTILAVLAALVTIGIAIIVSLGENDTKKIRGRFVLLATFVCLWILGNVVYALAAADLKYYTALISYGLAMGLVVQLMLFCVELVHIRLSLRRLIIFTAPGFLLGILAMAPGIVALGIENQAIITNKINLAIYGLVLFGYIITSCVILIAKRKVANKTVSRQSNLILAGMAMSGVIGLSCNLVLPLLGIYAYTQLGPASASLFIGVIAYAIVRQGLFNIKFAAVRTVAYLMVLGTLIGVYFGLATLFSLMINGPLGNPSQILLSAFAALLLAVIFHPIKQFFDRLTSRVFYQDNYDSDEFFARLTRALTLTPDLHTLLEQAATEISTTLKADQGYFFVNVQGGRHILTGTKGHSRLLVQDARMLDEYVLEHGDDMIMNDRSAANHAIAGMMSRRRIALILPLVRSEQIIGYMCLGDRRSNSYTSRDIRVIETVSDQLVIAIQNALAIQEIKVFNETLQQRIDEATKELRASNAQLQKLDEAKDEFVSMASHQLRTPLTSVKGYISMVLEEDAGKISDAQRHLLNEAFTSSERMVHLINDFLNVSRLQTGKFMVDRRAIDLAKITGQEVDSLKTTASARNLKLRYRKPSYFPTLYIDEGKIRQVIMNFIDNAIYYSSEFSTITISLEQVNGEAILTVHNEGIGVPESEKVHLFTKFFRAANARKQRPDGTGVGLYLSKMVVTAHSGKMVFDSAPNEGTTFGFRLPIKKLSTTPVESTD